VLKQNSLHLIPYLPEFLHDLFFATDCLRRVREIDMRSFNAAEIKGTFLVGVTAQRNDKIESLTGKQVDHLGTMMGNIDSDFIQNRNGSRVYECCLGTGGKGFNAIAQEMIDHPLCHLGTAGVGGTEKKNSFFQGILPFKTSIGTNRLSESLSSAAVVAS